jgi:hypothetical protein
MRVSIFTNVALVLGLAGIALAFALAGCGVPAAALDRLCVACSDDSQCGGNPCFGDLSGNHYCGRPCDGGCPVGYSCQPLAGTSGQVSYSCFPDTENCQTAPQPTQQYDLAGVDLAGVDFALNPSQDLAMVRHDMATIPCTPPSGGTVTASGGTVDRLYFGYTGDTRMMSSGSGYTPQLQGVINSIFTQMGQKGVEFAMDGGDHMEASNNSEAAACMTDYGTAAGKLGKPVFMTMGNHECAASFSNDCGYAGAATMDAKMSAYMDALKTISGQTSPYYRFDVMTKSGKAVFLVVADDAWNSTQQTWLTQQLTDADQNAKYTFVSKHHPDGNTDQPAFQQIYNLVKSHKYTLFLTGHSHEYKHQFNDHRAVVMGLGGAPFDNPNQMWNGYLTVLQCPDDSVQVTVYDVSTGNPQDTWAVPPQ